MRLLTAAALLSLVVGASNAHAATIARPDPVFTSVHLDYVNPLPGAGVRPLMPSVIPAALADQRRLRYQNEGDLGGFVRAPVGQVATSSGGRNLVGGAGRSEIPQFAQAGNGNVTSFAIVGSAGGPPDNGLQPTPGLPTPAPFLPPSNDNTLPPHDGFGGSQPPPPTTTTTPGTTTTAPKPSPPPRTTTTVPTTTTTTTTTTTSAPAPAPTPPAPESCGTAGLAITSDRSGCRIVAVNMAPGGTATETVTITNESGQSYALSLRAAGTQNRLWNLLSMGVWEVGTPAPQPLPPLLWWTTQDNPMTTLDPGQSVSYRIELFLTPTAGNDAQALVASIDFIWRARS